MVRHQAVGDQFYLLGEILSVETRGRIRVFFNDLLDRLQIGEQIVDEIEVVAFLQKDIPLLNPPVEDVIVGIFGKIADDVFGWHSLWLPQPLRDCQGVQPLFDVRGSTPY